MTDDFPLVYPPAVLSRPSAHVPTLIASVSAVQPTPLSESIGDGGQVGVGKGSDRHVEHRLREEAGH